MIRTAGHLPLPKAKREWGRHRRRPSALAQRGEDHGADELESLAERTFAKWERVSLGDLRRAIERNGGQGVRPQRDAAGKIRGRFSVVSQRVREASRRGPVQRAHSTGRVVPQSIR